MLLSTSKASSEHPQVCTPAFDGCRSRHTLCPPDASGFHQEARCIREGGRDRVWEYVPARINVSTLIARKFCKHAIALSRIRQG